MTLDVETCYMAGTALGFVSLPENWPAFIAWVAKTGVATAEEVNEATRQEMITAARYFGSLAETIEAAR